METTIQRPSLVDRLNDPQTAEVLHRLLDHAGSLDQALSVVGELPNLVSIAVDFFDSISRQASQNGIDIEQRTTSLLKLLVQITKPQNMQAIELLVSRLPKLEQGSAFLNELPNLVATAVDVFDEWATQVKADGIDLEQSLRQGLHAALYLGGQIRGMKLFESVGCIECHSGPALNGWQPGSDTEFVEFPRFAEDRIVQKYDLADDLGRSKVSNDDADDHHFKTPTLRNITLTAPYLHNGRVTLLSEACQLMANAQLDVELTDAEVADLTAFMTALEGEFPNISLPRLPSRPGESVIHASVKTIANDQS